MQPTYTVNVLKDKIVMLELNLPAKIDSCLIAAKITCYTRANKLPSPDIKLIMNILESNVTTSAEARIEFSYGMSITIKGDWCVFNLATQPVADDMRPSYGIVYPLNDCREALKSYLTSIMREKI